MAYKKFSPSPIIEGGTGKTSFTANAPIIAGTSSTAALAQVTADLNTAGYVLTANASGAPTFQVAGGGGGFTWNFVQANTSMVANNGYVVDTYANAIFNLLLPSNSHFGDIVRVVGYGGTAPVNSGYWNITQNASDQIFFGSTKTSIGTGGYLRGYDGSPNSYCIELICAHGSNGGGAGYWIVTSSIGNFTLN